MTFERVVDSPASPLELPRVFDPVPVGASIAAVSGTEVVFDASRLFLMANDECLPLTLRRMLASRLLLARGDDYCIAHAFVSLRAAVPDVGVTSINFV